MSLRLILVVGVCVVASSCTAGVSGDPVELVDADGSLFGVYTPEGFDSIAPEFAAALEAELLEDESFGNEVDDRRRALLNDGRDLITTLDPQVQASIRQAYVRFGLGGDAPDAAVVVLDRESGSVLGMSATESTATAIDVLVGSGRPTGSAMKPFALAAALSLGLTLDSSFPAPACITLVDQPERRTCGGTDRNETLLEATVASLNPVFVQLVSEIGVPAFAAVARDAGISTAHEMQTIGAVLGDVPVPVLDMANAYRTIANRGSYSDVRLIADTDVPTRSVLTDAVWADVDSALKQVVARGTAKAAALPVGTAGKTGTADRLTDAWFVGYNDAVVVAVWVGFLDRPDQRLVPPLTATPITGGSTPAELWRAITSS